MGTDIRARRYCHDHRRYECAFAWGEGDLCHRPAATTPFCAEHGRTTVAKEAALLSRPEALPAKVEAIAQAAFAARREDETPDLPPGDVVMSMLHMSYLRVYVYAALLEAQVEREGGHPSEPTRRPKGLIGSVLRDKRSGELYESHEAVRALVDLEGRERDRLVAIAEKAHKMGITERVTALAETWASDAADKVLAMLGEMDLTERQAAMLPHLIPQYLGTLGSNRMLPAPKVHTFIHND